MEAEKTCMFPNVKQLLQMSRNSSTSKIAPNLSGAKRTSEIGAKFEPARKFFVKLGLVQEFGPQAPKFATAQKIWPQTVLQVESIVWPETVLKIESVNWPETVLKIAGANRTEALPKIDSVIG